MDDLENSILIPKETIISKIYYIRGKKVMFDRDLAQLYAVETKALNQAVKRNIKRFPSDFMFQLNKQEMEIWKTQIVASEDGILRSQIVTSNKGGRRYAVYAFTEQGVAMLSSVLKSQRAIQINIQIIRTFTKLREILLTHQDLKRKLEQMEKKYDKQFKIVFDAISQLLTEQEKPGEEIGFKG